MHFLAALFFLFQARGEVLILKPLEAIPKPIFCETQSQKKCIPRFNCDRINPVKDCTEMEARLINFRDNEVSHLASVSDFIQTVQSSASNWYDYLSQAEDQTSQIPSGYFYVLSQGAADISEVSDQAAKNHSCLKKELDEILKAVQTCKKSQ